MGRQVERHGEAGGAACNWVRWCEPTCWQLTATACGSPLPQVSDVRPLLTVATYLDDQTGFEIYQEVSAAQHVAACTFIGNRGTVWRLWHRARVGSPVHAILVVAAVAVSFAFSSSPPPHTHRPAGDRQELQPAAGGAG